MKILITGGAGFIGSNLCLKLLREAKNNNANNEAKNNDNNVSDSTLTHLYCLDNLICGSLSNLTQCLSDPKFKFINTDVNLLYNPLDLDKLLDGNRMDQIYHLACPASPIQYQKNPIFTLKTNFTGTMNILEYARIFGGRVLLSSTSEIYGDPTISPQTESYWGNVNTVGPRSCYDEGKRVAETLMIEYQRAYKIDIRIVRIFNTYGPNMSFEDGRVVSNFIWQRLNGKPLTLYGEGKQTRSFCYIDDLLRGLCLMMNQTEHYGPINFGNPNELTMIQLAENINQLCSDSGDEISHNDNIVFKDLPLDDPKQRCPDITLAKSLGWEPQVNLYDGLSKTIAYFKTVLEQQMIINKK